MYQGTVGRLLNHSENCQVRKVVSLLTEALRQSLRDCPKRGTSNPRSVDLDGAGMPKWAQKYRFGGA
jgi:hypothetical protein